MNSIQLREQIISFLLQQLDSNARVIEELQKQLTELKKQVAESTKKSKPDKVASSE